MVVEPEGPVVVPVRLADGRMVHRHVDQLHPRVGEMENCQENGSSQHQTSEEGDTSWKHLLQIVLPAQNHNQHLQRTTSKSVSQLTQKNCLLIRHNITSGSQESVSESANAERLLPDQEPETGSREPTDSVRRSGRVRKPRQRYEGHTF